MNSHLWKVRKAGPEDIAGMLALNYAIYPEDWHVGPEYVEQVMQRNPEVYNVLPAAGGIKGIFSIFPLTRDHYDQVLNGQLAEERLPECILPYDQPKSVCLYLISLIVDIHDPLRKQYASTVIEAIPQELHRLEQQGVVIDEIGAIAISADGNRILRRIGFSTSEAMESFDQEFNVFRAVPAEIYRAIQPK